MTAFVCRRLTAQDAEAYRVLRIESLIRHPTAYTTALEDEEARPLSDFAARMEGVLTWGGFDADGALRGIVCITLTTNPKTRHIGTLWSVYVQEAARGSGLAPALMAGIIAEAREKCRSLRLFVTAGNDPARRLYLSQGFREYAMEKEALYHDGRFLDGHHMRLDFPAV